LDPTPTASSSERRRAVGVEAQHQRARIDHGEGLAGVKVGEDLPETRVDLDLGGVSLLL
jgi:hypothetical protein